MKQEKLTRVKAFVNAIYDNDKFIKLSLSEKIENGTDISYTKGGATIGKNKLNGEETHAFKKLKEMNTPKKLGGIDLELEVQPDYKNIKQGMVRNILGHYILTDEQYIARQERFANGKKQKEQSSVSKEAPVVKQEHKDVPGNLDI